MIKKLVKQLTDLDSIRKVFMNKRDIKIYDKSLANVSESRTEYDVEILASIIKPNDWQRITEMERRFHNQYPGYKFNYRLVEFDPNSNNNQTPINGKLIYDAEMKM